MPARLPRLAALAVLVAASCTPVERPPAPLDRFTYPTGLALDDGRLLVVSSNFDLTYEDDKGGSVLSVDPEASLGGPLATAGALRIPSFGGELAIADATACGLASGLDLALVPNRLTGELFALTVGADGGLSCGDGCRVPLAEDGEGDPFTVDVVCRAGRPPAAYVGWGRGRTCGSGTSCATISEYKLDGSGKTNGTVLLNSGGIRKVSYDEASGLLFFVSTGAKVGWIDLSGGCEFEENACPAQSIELGDAIAGFETRAIAASSAASGVRRLYVIGQLYDPQRAASGIRVDIGGVLLRLDLSPSAFGGYDARLVRIVSLGAGASNLMVIPRAGKRDLLALTLTGDGELWFWDDEHEAVTGAIVRERNGVPVLGEQPYGLAVQDLGAGERPLRLFVSSFADGVVSVVDLDPEDPSGALIRGRFGG